jgi:hypothetical protein
MAEFPGRPLAALLAAAAVGLAGCGGSSSPHVASLGTSTSSGDSTATGSAITTTTTDTKADPTRLLDEWGSCMQRHGDPNQPDPTVDANKVIHITWNPAIPGGVEGTNKGGEGNSGPGQYCRAYLYAAQSAVRGRPPHQPGPAELLKFSRCMRANGIPDFPDPTGGSLSIPMNGGGDLNATNPIFHNASKLCAHETGVHGFGSGTAQPGTIELNGGGPGLIANG